MYKIGILSGDGVGPEIMKATMAVMTHLETLFELDIVFQDGLIGGAAFDTYGHPFPDETKEMLGAVDAVLLGAVGGPKWDGVDPILRPEQGLLQLRRFVKAYCNIRPIICFEALMSSSPIKLNNQKPIDLCFVRELTGGIYFGEKGYGEKDGVENAYDVMTYDVSEIRRITTKAIEIAGKRQKKVTSIDKSNVLYTSKLWRRVVDGMMMDRDITLNHMYVDNAAMQMILNPHQFDVILTSNMFGDILSDEASVLAGSIGVLPSACVGDGIAVYEPIHGSAPDIANQNLANPIGMILSMAMMFEYSFNRRDIYEYIYQAVSNTLKKGYGTKDIITTDKVLTTTEWTERLLEEMKQDR